MRLVLLVPVAALALGACGGTGTSDRVTRAADAMEHLRGVRFSLVASSVATGGGSLGGDLALAYRATGELVPPDRLRLRITEPRPALLVIDGRTVTLDGQPATAATLRTLPSAIALLEQLREPGTSGFSGLGFARDNVTLRYRIDRGDRGVIEVELGFLDDLVRRQTFTISGPLQPDGSGLETVRTTYVVEYWDYGADLGGGEPNRP